MKEHSAAYKRLKADGAFAPKPGIDDAPCKVDAVKLCAWKVRRAAGHKDVVTKEHAKNVKNRALVKNINRFMAFRQTEKSKIDFFLNQIIKESDFPV